MYIFKRHQSKKFKLKIYFVLCRKCQAHSPTISLILLLFVKEEKIFFKKISLVVVTNIF